MCAPTAHRPESRVSSVRASGTAVAVWQRMMHTTTNAARPVSNDEPTCMLRWVFQRGAVALTCAVEAAADRSSYEVCVFPHWNVSLGTVERFTAPGSALQRHAEIALRLRESGWVAQYSATHESGIAA